MLNDDSPWLKRLFHLANLRFSGFRSDLCNFPARLIYNLTNSVDTSIHDSWLQWMQDEHLPEVLGTGCFEKHILVRLLDLDESEGVTYAVQYYAASRARYNQYQELYSTALRKKVLDRWGNRIASFHTLMQIIDG